jgi:poly(3-hydroxybutyrate) depolymerase
MKSKQCLLAAGILLAATTAGFSQPVITQQPQSCTNAVGTTATFSVTATGAESLAYQWQKLGGTWTDLADCTGTSLLLTNVQTSHAGDYRVIVSDPASAATSDVARLTIVLPPIITAHPADRFVASRVAASFTIGASGAPPLKYQWRRQGIDLPGATNPTLSFPQTDLTKAGMYTAVVTNLGGAATSRVAVLSVAPGWVYTNAQGTRLPYRLFLPLNYDPAGSYPLVLYLHGAGEVGSDNLTQLTDRGQYVFLAATNQSAQPCFLLLPQVPLRTANDDVTVFYFGYQDLMVEVLDLLQNDFAVDPDRLYITGLSGGGANAYAMLARFPERFAAGVPINGCWTFSSILDKHLKIQAPVWNFHAANDTTAPISCSDFSVPALRHRGQNPIYTRYQTGGHSIWDEAYATPGLAGWLMSQRRGTDSPHGPILSIRNPDSATVFVTNAPNLTLTGTAGALYGAVSLVAWTNTANATSGFAAGREAWSIADLPLQPSMTNFIMVTGTAPSGAPALGGETTFNDTLAVVNWPLKAALQFHLSSYSVAEDAGELVVTVTRSVIETGTVTVGFSTADGSALSGLDYVATNGTLTFLPGVTVQQFGIPILNDGIKENGETFLLILGDPSKNGVLALQHTATVTITDNDLGFQFEYAAYSVAEEAGSVLLAVKRGADTESAATVNFATASVSATSALDFAATNGTLTFAEGETLKFLTVPILNDALKEASETFRVTLSSPTGGATLGSQTNATITILDNDPGVQFEFNRAWVSEQAGALTVRVVRGNDVRRTPFTVGFGTGNLTAMAGADYLPTGGALAFGDGEMEKTFTVTILNDGQAEADEQFRLTLASPSGGYQLGINSMLTNIIVDATGMVPHGFEAVRVQPDRSVELSLCGCVNQRFSNYFDLYPIEVSSNLVDWTPLVTLQRTNASTAPLAYTDTEAANLDTRFYRTPRTNLITPFVFKPTGPFPVGVTARVLTDPSRRNRYGISTNCAFMVSVWYPAVAVAGRLPAPFEHPELAWDPTLTYYDWPNFLDRMPCLVEHALPDAPGATHQSPYPVVLYSPAVYGDHAQAAERGPYLASHGYVVVGLEHYDTFATVFPDGTQRRAFSLGTAGPLDRVQDMSFVVDELTRWNTSDSLFAGRLDLEQVAAMGIDYGAGVVAEFGRTDRRCKAVIALDTTMGLATPLKVPLLEITTPEINDTLLFSLATGEAIWFQLEGARHQQGGTDFYWASLEDPASLAFSREAARTMIAYELWFLNRHLKGEAGPPLPLPGFPLVNGFMQK